MWAAAAQWVVAAAAATQWREGRGKERRGGSSERELAREREGGIGRRGIQLDTIAMAHHPLVRH